MPKEEKIAIQKESPSKRNLTYDTNILCRVKSHYLTYAFSYFFSVMVVTTHLKIKAVFGVEWWLSFSKSKDAVKKKFGVSVSYQKPPSVGQKEDKI